MSGENEATIRAMYGAFSELAGRSDMTSYVSTHYAPEAVYEPVEEAHPVVGHDDLVRWHERWFDAWEELHAEPDELIARKRSSSPRYLFAAGEPVAEPR